MEQNTTTKEIENTDKFLKKHENANHFLLNQYYQTILDLKKVDLKIRARTREQQDLQKIFCFFVIDDLQYTLQFVGTFLNRNHGTIRHASETYHNLYASDTKFRKLADHVRGRFNTIDAKRDLQPIKKALRHKIETLTEKQCASVYSFVEDIRCGNQPLIISKQDVVDAINKQSKFVLND